MDRRSSLKKNRHMCLFAGELFWVGLGGAIGALLRHAANHLVPFFIDASSLFTAVFFENISGSFLIGILFTLLTYHTGENRTLSLFLLTGIIGSYTTYSGFMLENIELLNDSFLRFGFYFTSQIMLGILAVLAGIALTKMGLTHFESRS